MANSVDLHLNIQNSLEKNLERANKKMTTFNDKLSESEFATNKISKIWSSTTTILDKTSYNLSKVSRVARTLVPTFGLIFGGGMVLEASRDLIKYSQDFRELAHRMGDGVKSTNLFTNSMMEVSRATGLASDDVGDLIINLRNLRVPLNNVERAAILTAQFSEITGIAASSSARMYAELQRGGRIGVEATEQVMFGLINMQKKLGLSTNEVESLADGFAGIAQKMTQLGKSEKDILKTTKGTTALAVAFSKVGIEADKALSIIDDLMNPEMVEENAFLYAKLGISMSDAFSGNVDIVGKMIPNMRELGLQMKNMSGPAAVAMAKSLGMPLQVLRQFAEIDLKDMAEVQKLMTEEGMNLSEAFSTIQSSTRGMDKIISSIGNKLRTVIQEVSIRVAENFSTAGDKIREWDASKAVSSISDLIIKTVDFIGATIKGENSIKDVASTIFEGFKGFIGFIAQAPKLIPLIGIGLFMLLRGIRRRFYATSIGVAKDMTDNLTTAMKGTFDMMEERMRSIGSQRITPRKEADKPGMFSTEMIDRRNSRRMQENELQAAFSRQQLEVIKNDKFILEDSYKQIENRIKYLDTMEGVLGAQGKIRDLTFREKDEREQLHRLQVENQKEIQRYRDIEFRVSAQADADRARFIKYSSTSALESLYKEAESRRLYNLDEIAAIQKSVDEENKRLEVNREIGVLLEKQMMFAQQEGRGDDYVELRKKREDIVSVNEKIERSLTDQSIKMEEMNKLNENYSAEADKINEIYKKRKGYIVPMGDHSTEQRVHGTLSRVMETFGDVFRGFGSELSRFGSSFVNSAKYVGEGIKNVTKDFIDEMKANPIKKTGQMLMVPLRGVGNIFKSVGGLFKTSIGRMIGPMALMGLGMKLLQPLFEDLKPILDILTTTLQNVFGKVLAALGPPLLRVLGSIMPLLAALVNIALPPLIIVLGLLMGALGGVISAIGWLTKAISTIPGVGKKLDGVVKAMDSISKDFSKGAEDTIKAGKEMWINKVLDKTAVSDIVDSMNSTADKLASGEITITTKQQKDKWLGDIISLDEKGNIRVEKAMKEIAEEISIEQSFLKYADTAQKLMEKFSSELTALSPSIYENIAVQTAEFLDYSNINNMVSGLNGILETTGSISEELNKIATDPENGLQKLLGTAINLAQLGTKEGDNVSAAILGFIQSSENFSAEQKQLSEKLAGAYANISKLNEQFVAGEISPKEFYEGILKNATDVLTISDELGIEVNESLKGAVKGLFERVEEILGEGARDIKGEGNALLKDFFKKINIEADPTNMSRKGFEEIAKNIASNRSDGTLGIKDEELKVLQQKLQEVDHSFADLLELVFDSSSWLYPEKKVSERVVDTLNDALNKPVLEVVDDLGKGWNNLITSAVDWTVDAIGGVINFFKGETYAEGGHRYRAGGGEAQLTSHMNDGIIFKDNRVVSTHPDDHIIASKNKPEVINDSSSAKRKFEEQKENLEMIASLKEIVEGITNLLQENRKSSEILEKISLASYKTANNIRGAITPTL